MNVISTHGHMRGHKPTPTYLSWTSMKRRCDDPKMDNYKAYGARGITYCPEWAAFPAFLEDMGERPKGTSLDRIDNDKGYSAGNCRWATPLEQVRNKSNSVSATYQGVTQPLQVWADSLGVPYQRLWNRIFKLKMSVEDAFTRPVRNTKHAPAPP